MPEMQQSDATPGTLFLETTVQAARTLGSRREREAYRRAHSGCVLLSSTYVLGEFKKTFLRDAVRFHLLLLDSETPAEALQRLTRRFRHRTHPRCVQLFAVLVEDGEIDRDVLLSKLESLVEWQLEGRFLERLSRDLYDDTGCMRARAQATRRESGYELREVRCSKDDPPGCRIGEFWSRHGESLAKVHGHMRSQTDPESQRVAQACSDVQSGVDPHGTHCVALADTVISLECPVEMVLQTTNRTHFEPLCAILGKRVAVWRWEPPPATSSPDASR